MYNKDLRSALTSAICINDNNNNDVLYISVKYFSFHSRFYFFSLLVFPFNLMTHNEWTAHIISWFHNNKYLSSFTIFFQCILYLKVLLLPPLLLLFFTFMSLLDLFQWRWREMSKAVWTNRGQQRRHAGILQHQPKSLLPSNQLLQVEQVKTEKWVSHLRYLTLMLY